MLYEVAKHVAIAKEWEYMKIKSIYKGKGNQKEMSNQMGISITNILSKFFGRIIHTIIHTIHTKGFQNTKIGAWGYIKGLCCLS